jgi:hypothetical protein
VTTDPDYETLYKDLWQGVSHLVLNERSSLGASFRLHLAALLRGGEEGQTLTPENKERLAAVLGVLPDPPSFRGWLSHALTTLSSKEGTP